MTAAPRLIDTASFAEHLRRRAIDVPSGRVLIARLAGSSQEVDLTTPVTCEGFGRIRHFRVSVSAGWPRNPLPIHPACRALRIQFRDAMEALVFQNAACAWRCWYCFVPEALLNADHDRAAWFTADELIKLYSDLPNAPQIIDLSGGSPDLVPEWTVWMMEALRAQGLDESTYLWTDDNLSTNYLFDCLTSSQIALLRSYRNYGRVCCIKGFDRRSFSFNTRAEGTGYDRQFEILSKVVDLGLDVYGYVTLTSPHEDGLENGVNDLLDRLQTIDSFFPLRVVPLQIQIFTPAKKRINDDGGRRRSLDIQERAIAAWTDEIKRRYSDEELALPVCDVPLRGATR